MFNYFKDLFYNFKNAKAKRKFLVITLMVFYLTLLLMPIIKINKELETPGGINLNVSTNKFQNENLSIFIDTDNVVGNVYSVGIYSHKKVSVFQYLISYLNKDITRLDYNPKLDLSKDEETSFGRRSKDVSIINALIVAYEEAKKINPEINIDYSYEGVLVPVVYSYSKSNLEPDDIITHINSKKVNNYTEFRTFLAEITGQTSFKLRIIRDGVEKEINSKKVYNEQTSTYQLGILGMDSYIIDEETVYPEFKIHQNYSSIGGSGGAMLSLAIYNALLSEDITKEKRIMGTGTINIDGEIGLIGGVEQKIATAKLYNADIFFVDEADYNEAKAKHTNIKADFELVKVKTFSDIITYLRGEDNE